MKIIKYINKIFKLYKIDSNINKFSNILVVSNTGLGDTLLSIPAIKTLKKSFPDKNINFMVNYKIFPLFQNFEYVDSVIIYKNNIFNQIINIYKLKKLKIDTVFLLHSNGPQDIFFSILCGAKNILKATHNQNHEFRHIFINKPIQLKQHETISRIDLIKIFAPAIIDKKMTINKSLYSHCSFFKKNKIYIGLQIGAANKYKMWDINNFITLAKKILKHNDAIYIVILGNTNLEKSLSEQFPKHEKILNLCQKTPIKELAKVVNNLNLLITNDTGTMHLAIALTTPTISLFGPTDQKIFGPNQDLKIHKVVKKHKNISATNFNKSKWINGMDNITVNNVFNVSKTFLEENYEI